MMEIEEFNNNSSYNNNNNNNNNISTSNRAVPSVATQTSSNTPTRLSTSNSPPRTTAYSTTNSLNNNNINNMNYSNSNSEHHKNLLFKNAVMKVKTKVRAAKIGGEHYPELTGTLLSFINESGNLVFDKDPETISQFELLTKKVLIQCPKFSALERILEAHGWLGGEFDVTDKSADFYSLQISLGKLYYAHVWSTFPGFVNNNISSNINSTANSSNINSNIDSVNLFGAGSGVVNIFQSDRLIGAFCPNILYNLLSSDTIVNLNEIENISNNTINPYEKLSLNDSINNANSSDSYMQSGMMSPYNDLNNNYSNLSRAPSFGTVKQLINTVQAIQNKENNNSSAINLIKSRFGSGTTISPMASKTSATDLFAPKIYRFQSRDTTKDLFNTGSGKINSDFHLNRKMSFSGACVLADISGFTKLSAKLCEKGLDGLDELHNAASGFLGKYVQIVYSYKGDVISFAGDALICIFTPTEEDIIEINKINLNKGSKDISVSSERDEKVHNIDTVESLSTSQQMTECCKRALLCSFQLIDHFTEELTSHIAISCGDMSFASLGGYKNQWTYLLNGSPICELSSCIDDAGSKEVVVTSSVQNCLFFGIGEDDQLDSIRLKSGNYHITKMTLKNHKFIESRNRYAGLSTNKEILEQLKTFLPRPVLYAIKSDTLDTISELRTVTTMFLKLDSYSPVVHQNPLTLQPFFFMAQQAIVKYGGFMRQFLVDDKGCVLIVMWGVPSFTYSNSCARAVSCAIAIHRGTKKIGHHCSIGITNGTVFCGNIGSLIRRDFVAIGAEVNLSARLMGKAKSKIFLSESVFSFLPNNFKENLEKSEGMKLKGYNDLVFAYIADDLMKLDIITSGNGQTSFIQSYIKDSIIKHMNKVVPHHETYEDHSSPTRTKDIEPNKWLNDLLSTCLPDDSISCIIVEGASGSGKSAVSTFYANYASKCRIYPIIIQARPNDRTSTHGMLRKLFLALIGNKRFNGDDQQKAVCKLLIEYSSIQTISAKEEMKRLQSALGLTWSIIYPYEIPILSDRHYLINNLMSSEQIYQNQNSTLNFNDSHKSNKNKSSKNNSLSNISNNISKFNSNSSSNSNNNMLNGTPFIAEVPLNIVEQDKIIDENKNIEAEINILAAVIHVLLAQEPYAIVFDDAHFYNESSWKGLSILLDKPVISSILITAQISIKEVRGLSISPASNNFRSDSITPTRHTSGIARWINSFNNNVVTYISTKLSNRIAPIKEESFHSSPGGYDDSFYTNDENTTTEESNRRSSRILNKFSFSNNEGTSSSSNKDSTPTSSNKINLNKNFNDINDSTNLSIERRKSFYTDSTVRKYGIMNNVRTHSMDLSSPARTLSFSFSAPNSIKKDTPHRKQKLNDKKNEINNHRNESYYRIRKRKETLHLELKPLTFDEVKLLIGLEVGDDSFPDELVQVILETSSGNAFWCRTIINFIMEYGQSEFLNNSSNRKNALTTLIVCRLEKLSTEQQVVLKNAAVVGEEFSTELLQFTLPRRILDVLDESLNTLLDYNFITQASEDPPLYTFPNEVFHDILYDLTPSRERSKTHRNIAEQLEGLHMHDLDEYFPLLSYHYGQCTELYDKALEYTVKTAAKLISRGCLLDGLNYLNYAGKYCEARKDHYSVLAVVQKVLNDMKGGNSRIQKKYPIDSEEFIAYGILEKEILEKIEELNLEKSYMEMQKNTIIPAIINKTISNKENNNIITNNKDNNSINNIVNNINNAIKISSATNSYNNNNNNNINIVYNMTTSNNNSNNNSSNNVKIGMNISNSNNGSNNASVTNSYNSNNSNNNKIIIGNNNNNNNNNISNNNNITISYNNNIQKPDGIKIPPINPTTVQNVSKKTLNSGVSGILGWQVSALGIMSPNSSSRPTKQRTTMCTIS